MRKKKLILAMLIALCTTGCTVDYNLVIEDNKIKETTTFHQDSSDTDTKSYMYSQYLEEYPIYIDEEYLYYDPNKKLEGNTYYDKSITDDSNGYNATYKAEFKIKEYNRSRLFNDVFVNHSSGYDKKEGCYRCTHKILRIIPHQSQGDQLCVGIDRNYTIENGLQIDRPCSSSTVGLPYPIQHHPRTQRAVGKARKPQ